MDGYSKRNRVKKQPHFHLKNTYSTHLSSLIGFKNRLLINALLSGLLFTCSPTVFAALSATTAQVIQGNAPTVNETELKKLLGFTVKSIHYSEKIGNIDPAITKMFSTRLKLKLSDFQAKQLVATDILSAYQDTDGDHADPTDPFTITPPITITWKSGGTPISNLSQTIDNYATPLTMELSITVSAKSEFGLPNTSDPVTVTQIYKIGAKEGIYYLKPASMKVFYADLDPTAGGYDNSTFTDTKGFIIDSGFPTTGFANATFELKPKDGNMAGYTFSILSGSGATVDSSGKVTLNSNSYPVVIKASQNGADGVEDFITINITKWARVPNNLATFYDYKIDNNIDQPGSYSAADVCAGTTNTNRTPADASSLFFSRAEWGNAKYSTGDGWDLNGRTKRAVGTFIGEWGSLVDGYPNSPFKDDYKNIWTSDRASTKSYNGNDGAMYYKQYVIFLPYGRVGAFFATGDVDGNALVVCKN